MMSVFSGSVGAGLACCCDRCLLFYVVFIFTADINSLFILNERCYDDDDVHLVVCYLNIFPRI
jgi:hypothetical protein